MIRTPFVVALSTLALVALSACGEKPQTLAESKAKKADAQAWEGAQAAYTAPGWKAGDKASWETQLKTRAQQGQNEYNRSPATAAGDAKPAQ